LKNKLELPYFIIVSSIVLYGKELRQFELVNTLALGVKIISIKTLGTNTI